MDTLFHHIQPLFRFVIRRPIWILVGAVALAAVSLSLASRLSIDGDISRLIPEHYASYKGLQKVRDAVGGGSENALDVIVESPSFEANKAFAETLIPRALQLKDSTTGEPMFVNVDFKRDTEFIRKNALYFTTFDELDSLESYLRNRIEEEKLKANPFYFELDDEFEEEDSTSAEDEFREAYDEIVKKEYPISDDSTTMLVRFYPAAVRTDLNAVDRTHRALVRLVEELHPTSFHPEMETLTGGSFIHERNQIDLITRDIRSSFGVGASSLLIVVLLYFFFKSYRARSGGHFDRRIFWEEVARMGVTALLITIPLLMSLSWAYGLAYLTYEKLNALTAPLGLVLFGLGIDFGIHLYARYVEERGAGSSTPDAMLETLGSTGQAITVGAMTTAVALYVLTLADFRGFSEFGFLIGSGVLFSLLSMMIVLPAMIVLFERIGLLRLDATTGASLAVVRSGRRFPFARTLLLTCSAYVLLSAILAPRVEFNYNPGFTYQRAYNKKKYRVMPPGKHTPAMIVTDERDEIEPLIQVIEQKMASDSLSPTIGEVESLQDRVPVDSARQQAKLDKIAEIRELLDDPFIENVESEHLDRVREAAQTREPIRIEQVPDYLKRRFTTKTGEVGNIVMIYPAFAVSGGKASIMFANDVRSFTTPDGKTHYPGSTSLVAAEMIQLMQEESPWLISLTFLIIAVLMWVNFRSIPWAVLALVPVVIGLLWMLGTMVLLDVRLDFYNLVILPAVLGIGNDAGVHIVHRFRELGRGSIVDVLRSSGEHVAMASVTTMIGFGGLLMSLHTGISSIGRLAVLGISCTLIAAIVLLPALVQWLEDRDRLPENNSERATDGT